VREPKEDQKVERQVDVLDDQESAQEVDVINDQESAQEEKEDEWDL
jgi:hypothetical protein